MGNRKVKHGRGCAKSATLFYFAQISVPYNLVRKTDIFWWHTYFVSLCAVKRNNVHIRVTNLDACFYQNKYVVQNSASPCQDFNPSPVEYDA
jgi:hypothetical protein